MKPFKIFSLALLLSASLAVSIRSGNCSPEYLTIASTTSNPTVDEMTESMRGKTKYVRFACGWETSFSLGKERLGTVNQLGVSTWRARIPFQSEYKNEDERTQAQFAYDLHQYVLSRTPGWRDLNGHRLSYAQLEEYARAWWQLNSPKYRSLLVFFKDGFLYDAIIDATQIADDWDLYNESSPTTDDLAKVTIDVSNVAAKK
jgi:hypothetical protein